MCRRPQTPRHAAEGPLDERPTSRDWKVRREAYIELKARFEADDADAFAEFAGALDGAARARAQARSMPPSTRSARTSSA